jgi:hypothetical protein
MGTASFPSLGSGNGSPVFSIRFPGLCSIDIFSTKIAAEFNGFRSSGNRAEALYKGET